MAIAYKVLAQNSPSATTVTTLYTVPSSTSAVVSTIAICNRSGGSSSFRIAIRPAGAALANQHYLNYDTTVPPNDTIFLTVGVTLATTDVVSIYSSSANLNFSMFGSEIT
jgi:glucose-6-phosphate dehydrogenase assembly protein OpcA